LRRKYKVDHIPTKGLVCSKIWFSFKIAAINVKRVLKKALENLLVSHKEHLCFIKNRFFLVLPKVSTKMLHY